MKKSILVLCLSVFALSFMQAQELRFGIKGGVNVSTLGGDSYDGLVSFDSRTAYHVGVFAEIPLMMKFSIQPELLYSAQGSQFGGFFSVDGFDDQKLDYLNVPVLVKYNIIAGLSAELGPVFGYLISADGESIFDDEGLEIDNKEAFNDLDVGIALGASYSLKSFMFGLRYNKGISNVNNDEFTTNKNQNNVFQIWAGYSFL